MRRYLLATTALTATLVLSAAPAVAAPGDAPVAGDDRATATAGNAVGKDCGDLFAGSHDISGSLTISADDTYLDVTGVAKGVEVVAVIVKGGPAYNVYRPAGLGDLPWLDLHSPLVSSGKPAQISHWFACGVGRSTTTTPTSGTTTTTTTTTTATTTTTTTGSQPGSSTTPGTTSSSPGESGGATVTTTTSADVAPAAAEADDDLASTGFNGGWLIALAAGLLLAGGAVLTLMRRGARR